ncbi:carbohydrate porin [Luteolibacter marinus]|uniref:carbohydrate porin n=1 Tax=Luteolibacter marinus TaxID=2776705 RepID=UPI0018681F0B|nr:carbohydrate porin [Luteolibacter marinus]
MVERASFPLIWFGVAAALTAAVSSAASPEPPANLETDDIDANVRRNNAGGPEENFDFLEEFATARERWREALGLEYAVTFHSVVAAALLGDGVPTAAGGDLTLQGIWKPWHRWMKEPTELRFRLRSRHAFGDVAPSALRSELGTLWGVTDGFSDSGFEIPDFYLRHFFPEHDLEFRYGQMTIDSQFDKHALRSSKQAFLNQAFSADPAVAFPRFGAGFTIAKSFESGLEVTLGASTVQGTQSGDQVDFDVSSGDLFQALQFGYDFSCRDDRTSRLQLLLWRSDAVDSAGTPEGEGASLTFEQELDGRDLRGFARLAWSTGGAAPVETLLSGGLAWSCQENDLFGIAAGIGRGSGPGSPVQIALESFYRWQPEDGIRITPDVQLILGDDFNGGPGIRLIAGIRAGIEF